MKQLTFILLLVLLFNTGFSQGAGENKETTNSVLLNGSAITLKITDPTLRVDFQKQGMFNPNTGYLFGLSAMGKNNNGIASVFDGGNLVPSGKITGLAGLSFSNNRTSSYDALRENFRSEEQRLIERIVQLQEERVRLAAAGQSTTTIDQEIAKLTNRLDQVRTEAAEAAAAHTKTSFWKLTFFGFGGASAKSFRRFMGYDPASLLKSFQSENFRGGFGGGGLNYQFRNLLFGATLGSYKIDNQDELTEKKYNWEKTTTATSGETIKEAQEIKAYSGTYRTGRKTILNMDLLLNLALDKFTSVEQPRNYMLINPYLHSTLKSSDEEFITKTTNVGLGLYVLNTKSKLLGGIYVELPDVGNKLEKGKAVGDAGFRPALQKLSFGITTRFNLQSFLRLQDM